MPLHKAKSVEILPITITNEERMEEKKSCFQKFKALASNLTVEPVFVLYLMPSLMAGLATQNLNLEKACRVNLKFNKTVCDGMIIYNTSMYNDTDEVAVQKLIASMYAWRNVVQSAVPALLLMFVGSWSDRHKRRVPPIVLPIVGEACGCIALCVCTYFMYELSTEYSILAEAIPPALMGGWFTNYMGIFSYISDVSTPDMRTVRIGSLHTVSNISWTIGIALSGIMLRLLGFYGVYAVAISCYVTGVTYVCIRIKEKRVERAPEAKRVGFVRDFFDTKHIVDTFKVAFKTGERNRRKRICVIMILVMIVTGPLSGEYTVAYLFVRYKFQWDEIDYSVYSTYNSVVFTIGTIFSLSFFSKYCKMDDAMLGVISSMSKVLSGIVYAFAPSPTVFYLGGLIEMFNGTSFIAMRSIISKLVSPDELGKINSLFGVAEALMPLLYGPMYSLVYKWTIKVVPGAFFLFGGFLTIPAVLIFLWLYFEHKRDEKEAKENEAQKEELLEKQNGDVTATIAQTEKLLETQNDAVNATTVPEVA